MKKILILVTFAVTLLSCESLFEESKYVYTTVQPEVTEMEGNFVYSGVLERIMAPTSIKVLEYGFSDVTFTANEDSLKVYYQVVANRHTTKPISLELYFKDKLV